MRAYLFPVRSDMVNLLKDRSPLLREFLIFLIFCALTAILTWPWVTQLRDGVPDAQDTYTISYFLWWNYHQTFSDPLNLFHATFFYPYQYTLAFGEYDFGVSIVFFPLFALGFQPLTVYSIAAFLSFPFTAYGAFRLARTLSGSSPIAWIAAVTIAFVPFRFYHLAHLHLIFAGWIPLLFEALVLFARERSWKRAVWLGFAFLMNALTCTTWLILTLVPLALSGLMLLTRYKAWRERNFWLRAGVTLGLATLLLVPFLIPYKRAAGLYNFVRDREEVKTFSASLRHWLVVDDRNKLWSGLGSAHAKLELALFPGLVAPILAFAGLVISGFRSFKGDTNVPRERNSPPRKTWRRWVLLVLDADALVTAGLASWLIWSGRSADIALGTLTIVVLTRLLIAYPRWLSRLLNGEKDLRATISSDKRSEIIQHGLLWLVLGFAGSFGWNFFFYRLLYEHLPGFNSMRVASRWSMIAYVGLGLLAGVGAHQLSLLPAKFGEPFRKAAFAIILVAVLFELNVAPLRLIKGEVEPDELTRFLKTQQMSGGILELPVGESDYLHMLRAADHGKPIVNGRDSFISPLVFEIEALTTRVRISDRLFDLIEEKKISYVTVRNSLLKQSQESQLNRWLARGLATGRLRFIRSFKNDTLQALEGRSFTSDLYAVLRTEPQAQTDPAATLPQLGTTPMSSVALLETIAPEGFTFFLLHQLTQGRSPVFADFNRAFGAGSPRKVQADSFIDRLSESSNEEFVKAIISHADLPSDEAERYRAELDSGKMTRAEVLRAVADDSRVRESEFDAAFILLHYFVYLKRDPEPGGFEFWYHNLRNLGDYRGVNKAFAGSREKGSG